MLGPRDAAVDFDSNSSKRLRIAVVTPELPSREYPNRGRSVYQMLNCLAEYSELEAFCPLPRYPPGFLPRFDYRETSLSYSLPNVRSKYFEYPAIPVVSRPLNGFLCAHFLEPYLEKFRPDVILNFWVYPAGFAALNVGRKLHTPVVIGSIGSDLNGIPDPVSRWLTRRTLHGASSVITKSKELRSLAVYLGADPETTYVVANGCDGRLFFPGCRDAARLALKVPSKAELILFVGRMHQRKGIGDLLDAVSLLAPQRPNLQLVYVGDGPQLEATRERARGLNLGSVVNFAGACAPQDVARWLAASNLLALPSYSEGCPNAVIEALACGRPVVATRVGGIPDLVNSECGALVPAGEVEALQLSIADVLNRTWDEEAIAQASRRSWREVAEEMLAICQASCSRASA